MPNDDWWICVVNDSYSTSPSARSFELRNVRTMSDVHYIPGFSPRSDSRQLLLWLWIGLNPGTRYISMSCDTLYIHTLYGRTIKQLVLPTDSKPRHLRCFHCRWFVELAKHCNDRQTERLVSFILGTFHGLALLSCQILYPLSSSCHLSVKFKESFTALSIFEHNPECVIWSCSFCLFFHLYFL